MPNINRVPGRRDGGTELFRCVLMFLIVLHHCAYHGFWGHSGSPLLLVIAFTGLIAWHVDGFVSISGWYGIAFSWRKFFNLWLQVFFYTLLSGFWMLAFERNHFTVASFMVRGGWFVGAYFMLMFASPLLNAGVEYVSKQGRKSMLTAWAPLAIGILFAWLPGHFMTGVDLDDNVAFSFLTMMIVYVSSSILHKSNIRISMHKVLMATLLYVLVLAAMSGWVFVSSGANVDWHQRIVKIVAYHSPFVWILGILLQAYFATEVKLPEIAVKVFAFFGKSMFGIYLLHETTSFGRLMYRVPERWFATNTALSPILIVVLCAILVYFLALIVDLFRRCLFYCVRRMFTCIASRAPQSVETYNLMLSVITPTWNIIKNGRASAVETCVSSVKEIPFSHEHLMMDGDSKDGSVELLKRISKGIESCVVHSSPDSGLYDAMNKGAGIAHGEWLYFLGCDDSVIDVGALNEALLSGNQHDVDMVVCPVRVKNSNRGTMICPDKKGVFNEMPYPHQGVLMRKALFDAIGGYRLQYKVSGDFDLILRAHLHGAKIVFSPKPFALYDGGGISSNFARTCSENAYVSKDNLGLTDEETIMFSKMRVLPFRVIRRHFFHNNQVIRCASFYHLVRWMCWRIRILDDAGKFKWR